MYKYFINAYMTCKLYFRFIYTFCFMFAGEVRDKGVTSGLQLSP